MAEVSTFDGRERIARWGKRLEALVAKERGKERFSEARLPNEFIHVGGHDNSILEFVLERGWGEYRKNRYTRIVWSERHEPELPFAIKTYEYPERRDEKTNELLNDPEKPKQAFFDDEVRDFLRANGVHVERVLFGTLEDANTQAA